MNAQGLRKRLTTPAIVVSAWSPGTVRILALVVTLTFTGAVIAMAGRYDDVPYEAPVPLPWWLIAAAFFVTEAVVIHMHIGRSAQSLSMTEFPVVFGVFFLSPTAFVIARMLGACLALVAVRRQRPIKVAFNLAQFFLSSVIALAIVHTLHIVGRDFGPVDWGIAYLATGAENLVGVLAVAAAISLAEGRPQYRRVPGMLGMGAIIALTNTSLAVLAITVLEAQPLAGLLFAVPLLTAFASYRAYVSERQQHESLEMLYESTRILQRSPAIDHALVELLDHARRQFRAEVAEISLLPASAGEDVLRTVVGPGDERRVMFPIGTTMDDPTLVRAMSERRAILVLAGQPAAGGGEDRQYRNAIVAPLAGESRLIGTIMIADRLSDISTFDADDLRLLEAVANHTAVALENGQLEQSLERLTQLQEELHHQAQHDGLTGLANRALFAQSTAQRVEARDPSGRVPVVLFLDLDDFKDVNDSMGHAAGDALLNAVGDRIRACLREQDVAARLGGDEFGVLLWDHPDLAGSKRVADRLAASFEDPFLVEGGSIRVQASIGVASGNPGSGSGDELLRNADVAMYAAKAAGKARVVYFEPSMAIAVSARHDLTASLQRAVAAKEFVLHYQPVVDLTSGRIVGAEALLRWNHPRLGLLAPAEFIATAEESDLILPLGRWVLAQACQQARAWQERWPEAGPLRVSVNIAGRQLEQAGFVDEVLATVTGSGTDPRHLVLEVTESTLLADVESAMDKLRLLRAAGLGIAVDDFGTGYSSLSYLQRFPVTELKIAPEFLRGGAADPDTWALAEAIISMGRALGLDIVAEGVEQRSQVERLRELGCRYVQGFYFARPLEVERFEQLLAGAPGLAFEGTGDTRRRRNGRSPRRGRTTITAAG